MLAAAVLGLVIPVTLWVLDKKSSALGVEVISRSDLGLTLPEGVKSSLFLVLDGERVSDPTYTVIEFRNDGSAPISASNFEGALELKFGLATVLAAQVIDVLPSALSPVIERSSSGIKVSPLLLNPSDRFQIGVLSKGSAPVVEIRGRIAGVADVAVSEGRRFKLHDNPWLLISVIIMLQVSGLTLLMLDASQSLPGNWITSRLIPPDLEFRFLSAAVLSFSASLGAGCILLLMEPDKSAALPWWGVLLGGCSICVLAFVAARFALLRRRRV